MAHAPLLQSVSEIGFTFNFCIFISSWFGFILFFTTGNVLLLKEDIFFEPHETVVSMEYLLNLVVSFLKESMKMQVRNSCKLDFGCIHGLQPKVVDIFFSIGPLFWNTKKDMGCGADTGHRVWCGRCLHQVIVVLDFHIGSVSLLCCSRWLLAFWYLQFWHCRTDGFTMTPEWLLLDCLDLNLRHGWIAAGVSKFIMSIDYVVSANFLIQSICCLPLVNILNNHVPMLQLGFPTRRPCWKCSMHSVLEQSLQYYS